MTGNRKFTVFGCSHSKWGKQTWVDILQVNGVDINNCSIPGHGNHSLIYHLNRYLTHGEYLEDFERKNIKLDKIEDREIIFQFTYPTRVLESWDYTYDKKRINNYSNYTRNNNTNLNISDDYIKFQFEHCQYMFYHIMKSYNKKYSVMKIYDEYPIIPEISENYIDAVFQFLEIEQCETKYYMDLKNKYDMKESRIIDFHMEIEGHRKIAEAVIEKLDLCPINEKTENYMASVREHYMNSECEKMNLSDFQKYMNKVKSKYT